jgi:hypothetical protein
MLHLACNFPINVTVPASEGAAKFPKEQRALILSLSSGSLRRNGNFGVTTTMTTTSRRPALAAAAGLAGLTLLGTQALAYSEAVTNACTGDYLTYCSAYDENSAKGAQCMRAVATRLSQGCVNALVASGEASKSEVKRRSTAKR